MSDPTLANDAPPRPRRAITRATVTTGVVIVLNASYGVTHNGDVSYPALAALLIAGGFNVGSFFDGK